MTEVHTETHADQRQQHRTRWWFVNELEHYLELRRGRKAMSWSRSGLRDVHMDSDMSVDLPP
jgi:hypothetical protein